MRSQSPYCVRCGSAIPPPATGRHARRYCAKSCSDLAYAERNPERFKAMKRAWLRAHPEANAANVRRYRAKHPGVQVRINRRWRQEHPERRRAYRAERRGRELGGAGRWTRAEWDEVVRQHDGRCAYCGTRNKLTVDHRTPLSRGGSNEISNILPACASCNSRKRHRTEAEYRAVIDATAQNRDERRPSQRSAPSTSAVANTFVSRDAAMLG